MGLYFFDQYSILHFAAGVIAYFWDLSFKTNIIINIIFEIVENSENGMKTINQNFKIWPGGKPKSDSFINSVTDILFACIGWLCSEYLDKFYKKLN